MAAAAQASATEDRFHEFRIGRGRQQHEVFDESSTCNPTPVNHGEIIGSSPALIAMLRRLEAVAATPATALVLGETGVGKELAVRALHRLSDRARQRLVKVNCGSIPEQLFESEFFGHRKGSFTGAHRDRVGRFELADGGTLFLDEVGEIPISLQAKLLRVLQEGEFERIGDETTRNVDVRIVAATNRDLWRAVEDGTFREDLFYRLSVFPIEIPPLRERMEDVTSLARHFLEKTRDKFHRDVPPLDRKNVATLTNHHWPGNVRELRNLIERAVILSGSGPLNLDLAMPVRRASTATASSPISGTGIVTEADWQQSYRDNVVAALEASNWRISGHRGAASLLGINASTLRGRMKSLKIPMPRDSH